MTTVSIIASGFKEDCEKLISRFEECSDIRFQTFSEIWKDMKFSLVFSCRQTAPDLLEFCEEALHISKQYVLYPTRFKMRIGGLYLLYGIYYKMPTDFFKIRVTLEDWQSIQDLHVQIKEGEHLDANYVLSKMIVDNAFYHCVFNREFGIEKQFRSKDRSYVNPYSVAPAVKDLAEPGQTLTLLNDLIKQYQEKKREIWNDISGTPNLFNENIGEELIEEIRKLGPDEDDRSSTHSLPTKKNRPKDNAPGPSQRIKRRRSVNVMLPKIGHGFASDSAESAEDEELMPVSNTNSARYVDILDSD